MKTARQPAPQTADIDWVMILAAIVSIGLGIGIAATSVASPLPEQTPATALADTQLR